MQLKCYRLIQSNSYLKSLAARPFLLTKMAQALPRLQAMLTQNQTLNSASVYRTLIDDTLDRDGEKHILHPRHKHRLLQDFSYVLWQQNEQMLTINELNDWYQAWLHQDEDIYAQYKKHSNAELEQDLRNSTLLLRFGEDDFGFTHSSMQEYFLAQKLISTWKKEGEISLSKPI